MPRLNDLLTTKWKQPVFIANEGWGGITTGRYLAMMRSDKGWQERMRLLKPNVWLIHLGVNDERAKLPAAEVAANAAEAAGAAVAEFAADFDDGDDVVWDDAQDNAEGAQYDAHDCAQDDAADAHEQTPMQAGGAHDDAHAPESDEFVISGHHEVGTCVGTGGPFGPTAAEGRRLGSIAIERRPPTEQRRPSEVHPSEQRPPAELREPEQHVIDLDDEIEAEIGLDESMDVTMVEVPRGGVGGGGGGGGDDDRARGEGDGGG
jgi:hypothetical protein